MQRLLQNPGSKARGLAVAYGGLYVGWEGPIDRRGSVYQASVET